jgi:hypothetical protein
MKVLWPWLVLVGLGAFHGLNPGMGWLFAVALGLQEQSQRAVRRALLPIALGHAASISVIVLAVGLLQAVLPEQVLRYLCAALLGVFGLWRLVRARHPRWVGMRVGFRDLMLWSFLMASAHGAGLMLVPLLLQWPAPDASHARLLAALWPQAAATSPALVLAAVSVHTLSLFLVTSAIALLVYEKLGVAFLRHAWFNLDVLWAAALFIAGVMALV